MANQEITARLKVQAEGLKEARQDAQDLNRELTAAQKAMAATRPSGASRARAAAMAGSAGPLENIDYGRARGIGGTTGAASRDFANQAQGLGGLVRLYATFAANIFAVSAAFTALKNAADTANLIKGLDQLGARSGIALGQLAAEFTKATDGIVSLREAAEVTAKATASGLSSKQVLEIAKVAKSASQALGVDALDAVNRLTRGITKLEPELLDEIGIFTKIDPAVQEYARSLNKTAGALTDFERRQAFAVAALKEGAEKFGTIELDANPYSKLLASTKNVAQQILEFVNVALTPLIGLLASSPTALLGVITAIGTLLLKQAVPAVGEFRAGLQRQADEAAERAQARQVAADAAAATAAKARRAIEENNIDALIAKQDEAVDRYNAAKTKQLDRSKTAAKLLVNDIQTISDADIAAARKEADKLERGKKAYREQGKSLRELADSTELARNAQQAYIVGAEQDKRIIEERKKGYGILALNQKMAATAAEESNLRSIKSNAALNASLSGVKDATVLAFAEIDKSGASTFTKTTSKISVLGSAIAGATSTILRFASGFLGWVGVIASVIGILDSFMDKSKEALGAFDSAVDRADKATKHLGETFKAIFASDAYSVQAIQARSNALSEQSIAMDELTKSAMKAKDALTGDWWANIKDTFASLFGGGVQKNFEKTFSKQLFDTIKNLDNADLREKLTKSIQSELNIGEVNFNSIIEAVKNLDPASDTVKNLNAAIKQTSVASAEAASKASQFADGFKKGTQLFADLKTQFSDKSPITQWAIQSTQSLNDLAVNMDGPIQDSIANLTTALAQMSKNPIFGPQAGAGLLKFADAMRDAREESKNAAKQLKVLDEQIKKQEERAEGIKAAYEAANIVGSPSIASFEETKDYKQYQQIQQELNVMRAESAKQQARQQQAFAQAEKIRDSVAGALSDGVRFSAGLVAKTINAQIQKGATEFLQQYYAAFDTVPQFAGKIIELKIQEISNQLELIKTQKDLLVSQERLGATYNKVSAEEKLKTLVSEGKGPDSVNLQGSEEYQKAAADVKFYTESLQKLELVLKNPVQAMRNLSKETGSLTAQQIAQNGVYQQVAVSVSGLNAQIAQQSRQIANLREYEKPLAELRAEYKAKQELNDVERQRNDVLRQRMQLQMTGLDEIGKASVSSQVEALAIDNARLEEQRAINAANEKYLSKLLAANQLQTDAEKSLAKESAKNTFYNELELAQSSQRLKTDQARVETIKQQTAAELQQLNQRFELESKIQAANNAAILAGVAIDKARIDAAITLNQFSDTYVAQLQYSSSIKEAETQKELARIQAEFDYRKKLRELEIRDSENARLLEQTKDLEAFMLREAAIKRERDAAEASRALTLSGLDIEYAKTLAVAGITQQIALSQAKFNEELERSTRLTDALAGAFGEIGKKLGDLTTALLENSQTQEKNASRMKQLQDDLWFAQDQGDKSKELKVQKEIDKQKKKSADDELKGNAKILASTKAMLKEKTGGYKVLDAMEKATHVMRMTNTAIEYATKIKTFAMELAAAGSLAVKEAGLENASLIAKIPAYTAGIFGKITSQIGLPGPVVAAGIVAAIFAAFGGGKGGTGTINTTGLTAEDMNKVSGTGQQFINGQLVNRDGGVVGDPTALADSITSSIESLSRNFFNILNSDSSKVVRSLRGVEENTDKTVRALLGEISGFAGTNQSPFGTVEQSVSTKSWNWWTGGFDKKKIDTKIISAGIRIEGELDNLINQTGNTVLERWENVLTTVTKSSWWGLKNSTKQYLNRISGELDPSIRMAISDTLVSFKQTLQGAAVILEGNADRVNDVLKDFKIQINTNLAGLSGEEAISKLTGEFSINLNRAVQKAYPWITLFTKVGEEYAEAAMRIANDSENVRYGLRMIGVSLGELDTYSRTLFEQDLIDQFGDLDQFATSINYYVENFIDAATRYSFSFDRLTEAFADAELELPKSKKEYISLVDALKESSKTSSKSKEQLVALLKYSEAYNKLLEDNLALKKEEIDNLNKQASELENSSKKFADFAKSLQDFRSGLLLGATSILTPLEKYSKAGSDFQTILNKALTGDVEAYGKLQSASNDFLTASQKVYASGPQYIQDFNTVTQALESAEVFATNKSTIEQLQLDGINRQITLLESIDTNIAAASGGSAVTSRAIGGLSQGLTLVGERGPEVVDFKTSGRVYTATQTQGMFNTNQTFNEMIRQIQALKSEISSLRADQQKQTGDMIITNYDATNKLGEQIAEVVVDAVVDSKWKDRAKVEIV
jgi:hypothetical protein